MPEEKVQTCRCGKTFVQRPHHKSGKLNPISTYQVENGNVEILDDGRYRIIPKDEAFAGQRHVSHFSDCPFSTSFKRS